MSQHRKTKAAMPKMSSPELREFAQRLLAHKTVSRKSAGGNEDAAFRICEHLRVSLGRLMGVAGYRALFARAVALAGAEVPWLLELRIKADGLLEGLAELKSKLNDRQIAEGEIALVSELVGLMETFIGARLTFQLIQDAWPEADLSKLEF